MFKLSVVFTFIFMSSVHAAQFLVKRTLLLLGLVECIHSERHRQIQQEISRNSKTFNNCTEYYGELIEPIVFYVKANGTIEIENSSVKSKAYECVGHYLSNVTVEVYSCDMNVPYKWNGKFPLINKEVIFSQ